MAERAARLGDIMVPELKKLNPAVVKTARGKGLMNAIEIIPTNGKISSINYHCSVTFKNVLEVAVSC